jgi:gas vesicle protein
MQTALTNRDLSGPELQEAIRKTADGLDKLDERLGLAQIQMQQSQAQTLETVKGQLETFLRTISGDVVQEEKPLLRLNTEDQQFLANLRQIQENVTRMQILKDEHCYSA